MTKDIEKLLALVDEIRRTKTENFYVVNFREMKALDRDTFDFSKYRYVGRHPNGYDVYVTRDEDWESKASTQVFHEPYGLFLETTKDCKGSGMPFDD